ncbi:stearoyl-CoA 9-desaturase [Aspergillus fumigatus]
MISDDVQGPEAKPDDGTTDHAPMPKSKSTTARASHITEQPVIWSNWHQHTNWLNCFFILFVPLVGCIGAYWAPLHPHTALFALIYYFNVGLGITAGYHRCWAHCSYKATLPLKLYLAAVGVAAGQGSIRWWARGHRVHHRYTDTEKGPYSVRRRFYIHTSDGSL